VRAINLIRKGHAAPNTSKTSRICHHPFPDWLRHVHIPRGSAEADRKVDLRGTVTQSAARRDSPIMRTIRKKIDALKAKRKAPKQTSEDVQGPTRKSASPKPAPTKERTVVTAREIQADEGEQEQTSDVPQVQEVQQIREPRIMDFGQSLSPSTPTTLSVDFNFEQHSLEIARAELKDVSEAFDTNYHKFLSRHATLVTFDAEVKGALNTSHSEANIQVSAKLFRHQLNKVSQSYARSKEHLNWHKKVGNFVASLYPVVRLTLGVTSDVAGVQASHTFTLLTI